MKSPIEIKRIMKMNLQDANSAFLWGARQTGKSTYLASVFPKSIRYDLLQTDLYLRLLKEPYLLREEIISLSKEKLRYPIIIDEVQKVPLLLNEVHWLIENSNAYFVLCGSSARKLKHGAANLLGGRALRYTFFPLVFPEIENFDLLRALNVGLLPKHYLSDNDTTKFLLQSYINDYLTEEVQAEGLTRNLPAFARFLDVMAFSHGELINYSNIARDCGVDKNTVKEYFQILVDTLLGYFVLPYNKKIKRETITSVPKFYFFDVGIVNTLSKKTLGSLRGAEAGKAFEHYILMELVAYAGIMRKNFPIKFWRTKTGLEVDFILGDGEVALEVKISDMVRKSDLNGLIAFQEEHRPKKALVVSLVPRARKLLVNNNEIEIIPWKKFLQQLWRGEVI